MKKNKIEIKVNSNFHHLEGEDLFEKESSSYREYRKKWSEWPQTFYAGAFPLFIDIESTSACNLKCPFCATTFREGIIKKGFMGFDTVKKIIDEGADKGLCGVKFSIRGEPLLHPRIHDFVAYAKKKGLLDIYFNTNAVLLTEEVTARLIDAGLDRISISVEGYTKDVYERHRTGAKFEKVLSNIENTQLLKRKRKVKYPKVRIQAVMIPGTEHILQDYRKFWTEKADEVAFLDYKEMKKKRKGVKYKWACPQLWQRMAVWWDGTIMPCNHDDDGLIALGNINDTTVEEAWHSQNLNSLRGLHKKGLAHTITAGDGCYLRDSEIAKLKKDKKI